MQRSKQNNILKLMREEYTRHLYDVLKELSVFDSRGELIIGSDLKVVHEPSGLEYTVQSVDGVPGNAKITLRTPDQPRQTAVDPSALHPDLAAKHSSPGAASFTGSENVESFSEEDDDDSESSENKKDYGIQAHPPDIRNQYDKGESETIFVVSEKEFEKNYKEA
jgi:hypothetical protein